MTTVRIYTGSEPWRETEVGRLVDNNLEVGRGPSTLYPAHIDTQGNLSFGATWQYGPSSTVLGQWNESEKTVSEGWPRSSGTVGSWDDEGNVYGPGPEYRREKIGRCDPASGAGAACLLLVLAANAPHKKAIQAATDPASAMGGMEVVKDSKKKPHDPGHQAAVVAGAAVGAAALGAEIAIAETARQHKKAQAVRAASASSPSRANQPASPSGTGVVSSRNRGVVAGAIALTVAAAIVLVVAVSGGNSQTSYRASPSGAVITGAHVQSLLSKELRSRTSDPVRGVSCPRHNVGSGGSLRCEVSFASGRQQVIIVHVSGATAHVHLEIGLG